MKNIIIYVVCHDDRSVALANTIFSEYHWARIYRIPQEFQSDLFEGAMFKTELMKIYDEWKSADYVGLISYSLFGKVDTTSILDMINTSDPKTTDAVFFCGRNQLVNHANVGKILTDCMLTCKIYEEKCSVDTSPKLKFLNLPTANYKQQTTAKTILDNIMNTDHAFCNSFMTKPIHMLSYIDFFVNIWIPSVESHPLINTDPEYISIGSHTTEHNNSKTNSKMQYTHRPFVNERILIHHFKDKGLKYLIHYGDDSQFVKATTNMNQLKNPVNNSINKNKRFHKQTKNSKTLVLYAFHEYNSRVLNFINNCIFYDEDVDFLVIANSLNSTFDVPEYVKVLNRENIGFDFGAWSHGLLHDNIYKNYDYFIFINSSVIGPYLPMYYSGNWTDIFIEGLTNEIKLFGCTINCNIIFNNGIPHVQSYCFSMNKETLEFLIAEDIFSISNYASTMNEAIYLKEIRMSSLIINNGWNIGCLMKYYNGIDFRLPPNQRGCNLLNDMVYNRSFETKFFKAFEEIVFIKGNRLIDFELNEIIDISFNGC